MAAAAIHGTDSRAVDAACELLRTGDLVAMPTETVYGLAADALNESAVRKIFAVKGRPLIDPLIIHVADRSMLESLALTHETADRLADAFWPGPLTLVLPKRPHVPDLVTAGRPTVAVRMPSHPLFREVLLRSGLALAAPSANPFGYVSPTRARHVRDSFGEKVPHILDGGPCAIGLESTIVDCSRPDAPPRILRTGPIDADALARILGHRPPVANTAASGEAGGLEAPGMLSRHYSPAVPLRLTAYGSQDLIPPAQGEAVVCFKKPTELVCRSENVFWLTESGDTNEAARNLFHLLRTLDTMAWKRVTVECAPEEGIGAALNDRLRRAAAK